MVLKKNPNSVFTLIHPYISLLFYKKINKRHEIRYYLVTIEPDEKKKILVYYYFTEKLDIVNFRFRRRLVSDYQILRENTKILTKIAILLKYFIEHKPFITEECISTYKII